MVVGVLLAAAVAWPSLANASGNQDDHVKAASDFVGGATRNAGRIGSLFGAPTGRTVSERIIDGELALRGRSYDEAIGIFTKVLESTTPADGANHYNARWLRAQALWEHGEPSSAAREYQELVAAAGKPGSGDYPVRAVDRIVAIGLALHDSVLLKQVLSRAESMRLDAADQESSYARAKAYIEIGEAAKARGHLTNSGADRALQTGYYEAMLLLREESAGARAGAIAGTKFPLALAAFQSLAAAASSSTAPDAASLGQLASLAVARIFYERREFSAAAEIYKTFGTQTPVFEQAAAELAWAQVQRGDSPSAERALELLAEARPRSSELAEGQLLRADLALKNGSFGKALELYKSVRAVLDPQRTSVDRYLTARPKPDDFFELISAREMDIAGSGDKLPPMAIKLVREEASGKRAIDLAADLGLVRGLVEQVQRRAKLLERVAADPNRATNLSEFRGSTREITVVANQVCRGRLEAVIGLDEVSQIEASPELQQIQARRRLLMPLIEGLPLSVEVLSSRGTQAEDSLRGVADSLVRLEKEVVALLAQVDRMRDLVARDEERGVTRDASARARVLAELDINAQSLVALRDGARETKHLVGETLAQSGGESGLLAMEAAARREFNSLVDREFVLAASAPASVAYVARVLPVLDGAKSTDAILDRLESEVREKASDRAAAVQLQVAAKLAEVTQFVGRLEEVEKEARSICGGVARTNVELARKKLHALLLKADVGISAHAWTVREEAQHRVTTILTEKAKRERLIDDEMRDALEEGPVAVFKDTNSPAAR